MSRPSSCCDWRSATSRTVAPPREPRRPALPRTRERPRAASSKDKSPTTGSRPSPSSPPPTPTASTPTSDKPTYTKTLTGSVTGGPGRRVWAPLGPAGCPRMVTFCVVRRSPSGTPRPSAPAPPGRTVPTPGVECGCPARHRVSGLCGWPGDRGGPWAVGRVGWCCGCAGGGEVGAGASGETGGPCVAVLVLLSREGGGLRPPGPCRSPTVSRGVSRRARRPRRRRHLQSSAS